MEQLKQVENFKKIVAHSEFNILGEKKIKKRLLNLHVSGLTLTNNEVTYVIKIISSLENRGS